VPSPHAPARDPHPIELVPDLDLAAPLCDDCGYQLDTTQHATICEEQP
jgi:hypothetical protein